MGNVIESIANELKELSKLMEERKRELERRERIGREIDEMIAEIKQNRIKC